jgi:hypothetical protein
VQHLQVRDNLSNSSHKRGTKALGAVGVPTELMVREVGTILEWHLKGEGKAIKLLGHSIAGHSHVGFPWSINGVTFLLHTEHIKFFVTF